ncbi:hypothetical protein [Amaricoccus macauensis]|uniref:hypothetical protein n=1 Tax=Amaricoccus macauensis TaxID=57001 RepID=UPI003C7DE1F7
MAHQIQAHAGHGLPSVRSSYLGRTVLGTAALILVLAIFSGGGTYEPTAQEFQTKEFAAPALLEEWHGNSAHIRSAE